MYRSTCFFLLKILVKLPNQLEVLDLGKNSQLFVTTKKLVDALLKFLVDFRSELFPSTLYREADQAYVEEFNEITK